MQRWMRSTSGQWIGVVTILLSQSDGRTDKAVEQVVPAEVLRPR
jgi:hypothetical protein